MIMTRLPPKIVCTMTYSDRPHSPNAGELSGGGGGGGGYKGVLRATSHARSPAYNVVFDPLPFNAPHTAHTVLALVRWF